MCCDGGHPGPGLRNTALGESYTSVLCSDAARFSGPQLISDSHDDSGKVCCTHFNFFSDKNDVEFSVPKNKGTIQTFISDRSKSKLLSWYISANSMGDCHICKGTIDMEAYIGVDQRNILRS